MGLNVPGVSWPLTAFGNLLMGANRVTFSDVGLIRGAAGRLDLDDGAGGTGRLNFLGGGSNASPALGVSGLSCGIFWDAGVGTTSFKYNGGVAASIGNNYALRCIEGVGFTAGAITGAMDAVLMRSAAGRLKSATTFAGVLADFEAAFLWHANETAPGAATATLTNAPAGAAGNPDKWLQVKDAAGTVHVIPAWTP